MKKEIEPKPEFQYNGGVTTTISTLLGQQVTEPRSAKINLPPTKIGRSPIFVFGESRGDSPDSVYTIVIKDLVKGRRLNQIHWEMALGNSFGLDYDDILSDHTSLLVNPEKFQRLIAMHEQAGKAWKVFKRYGPGELEAIKMESSYPLIPVIRWWNNNGVRKFVYSAHMHTPEGAQAAKDFLKGTIPDSNFSHSVFDPALGLYVLAMVSPDIKNKWPARDTLYEGGSGREIGSTQAPLNTLRKDHSLSNSLLLLEAESLVVKNVHQRERCLFS